MSHAGTQLCHNLESDAPPYQVYRAHGCRDIVDWHLQVSPGRHGSGGHPAQNTLSPSPTCQHPVCSALAYPPLPLRDTAAMALRVRTCSYSFDALIVSCVFSSRTSKAVTGKGDAPWLPGVPQQMLAGLRTAQARAIPFPWCVGLT